MSATGIIYFVDPITSSNLDAYSPGPNVEGARKPAAPLATGKETGVGCNAGTNNFERCGK